MSVAEIGVYGMGVMGRNLAVNFVSRGFKTAIYNRSAETLQHAIEEFPHVKWIKASSLEDFVNQLEKPRKVVLMIAAGKPVDMAIDAFKPLLDKGDIIVDAGNSHFEDSQRRYKTLKEEGIHFMGLGVSGGELGARLGPALMPGGSETAFKALDPYLQAIAARAEDNTPCSYYFGKGGAGHFVKMVHNGIEYADMAMITEIYFILRELYQLDNLKLSALYEAWNKGELSSYLIEITAQILKEEDPDADGYLLNHILDVAEQKGTGMWTNLEAINLGVDASVLAAGLNMRFMSMQKENRIAASQHFATPLLPEASVQTISPKDQEAVFGEALLAAKIIAYAQGFSLYSKASETYHWNLSLENIAATFRAGCIIRAKLLQNIMQAYRQDPALPNLLLASSFKDTLEKTIPSLRWVVATANLKGIPIPALSSALAYFDALRTKESAANLIQAQRDFFGAHTYQRIDKEGYFHHKWEEG